MSTVTFKNNEICVGNDCRYLPKNGPLKFAPMLKFTGTSITHSVLQVLCIIMILFIIVPFIIQLNGNSVTRAIDGSIKYRTAYDLLNSMGDSQINIITAL